MRMTTWRQRGTLRGQLLAAGVFAALLAQMALPALHALREGSPDAVSISRLASAASEAGVVHSAPAHDPAACPVCRSLMRTTPVAMPPATGEGPCAEHPPAVPESAPCADAAVVMLGHPPRAPPSHALHLA